jgi:hypothetical protein
MLTKTVNIQAGLTNESKTNLKMKATNGVIIGLQDKKILRIGDAASGSSQQVVPNAFVGSVGTYDLILSSVGYEGVATDESGEVIEKDKANFKVKGKVKYITTQGLFNVTTTQEISLEIDTNHDDGDTRVLAAFGGDYEYGSIWDVAVVSSYLTKTSSKYTGLKSTVISEDGKIKIQSRDTLSLDEFDKLLKSHKKQLETV